MTPTATVGCSRRSRRGCPGASTQRQRPSHRRGRCELARLVRRVHGGGAGRSEASDVIESDLIIGGSPGDYALGPEAGTLPLAKSIERQRLKSWAFVKSIRKLYYNMTITCDSVIVALEVGRIKA